MTTMTTAIMTTRAKRWPGIIGRSGRASSVVPQR
jgi:hypothetical protein